MADSKDRFICKIELLGKHCHVNHANITPNEKLTATVTAANFINFCLNLII